MIQNEAATYAQFAERVRGAGLLSDPWLDGQPRFATEALTLTEPTWQAVARAAEAMAQVHDELVRLAMQNTGLFDSYFNLRPVGKAMWECAAPRWHGIARADVFMTANGPVLCELNSDTPSGQAEAVTLSHMFVDGPGRDPNLELEARFCAYVAHSAHGLGKALHGLTVGILYPTEFTEDLGLVLLYERWLVARGARVVLGSPFNLRPSPSGRVALLGQPCDVFIRHYKTDWWAERAPVWLCEAPFPDAEPLTEALAMLLSAEMEGKIAVLNPFGAIVAQNKRSLALMWEEQQRFSAEGQAAIARYLPPSFRLETQSLPSLRQERETWVLKSDYGCEGEETIVGRATTQAIWEESLAQAVPGRWIVQRRFEPVRDSSGQECNLGVYLIAGVACGLYARRSVGPTDVGALSSAVRIVEGLS
ncbi:MAG TPA: glutathionylspermidine synthase family protein [Polyangia bacterium]